MTDSELQGGAITHVHYLGGYIFLSYVISWMGCATTLEMLHRRTSRSGFYNWYLLLTSSITMGGIGIWCMHFIGNRAIVLGDGAMNVQIIYNVAFTGTSFVLPVVVLLFAFYSIGVEEKGSYIRILIGGLLTGSSVCGMHYVGQLGIANYRCSYHVANVVGSAIIALVEAWRLRVLARRGGLWDALDCRCRHYYWARDDSIRNGTSLSRSQVVIVCAVLACVSCLILSACAIVAGGNRRRSEARAHQLILACAYFDPAGRVMVTPQALLPSKEIVDHYIGRTFKDDDLTRTHPTFLWAFRASRNWPVVKDLIPFMRNRLDSEQAAIQKHLMSRGVVMNKETELQTDFDTLFKHMFCVSAQELSNDLRTPLRELGALYDNVISTSIPTSRIQRAMGRSAIQTGKGQIMFTVRQLQKQDAQRFASVGFRFATIENISSTLSRRMHVPESILTEQLRDMRDYATTNRSFSEGVHLISFVMRPTVQDHFEILTTKGTGNPLPSSTLPLNRLKMAHLDIIAHMEGWSMNTCIKYLESNAALHSDPNTEDFRKALVKGIISLAKTFPPAMRDAAIFSARPLYAPCRVASPFSERTPQCTLLTFCVVGTLDTQVPNPDYTFTPFRLFRVQQQVNDSVTDRDGFSRELGQELFCTDVRSGSNPGSLATESSGRLSSARTAIQRWWPLSKSNSPTMSRRALSQESLVEPIATALGDITVQKEVRVDVTKLNEAQAKQVLAHDAVVAAGDAVMAGTYVDELYSLCYAPQIRLRADSAFHGAQAKAEA
ncbi:hypothetical protein N7468_001301 [Penicillium chermesinum]|uniref:MHYT domain-containing protein n=1 Tax=Penicillium chermesinum TaxID=63820 RepID=A0A9W9PGB7_9EURO|nr:uncharacterized protein N7468_001301 [Penicillium chermesinum]KAJ5246318.1 hypothetical protein N7468_001301 [Penicillium chermesinum]